MVVAALALEQITNPLIIAIMSGFVILGDQHMKYCFSLSTFLILCFASSAVAQGVNVAESAIDSATSDITSSYRISKTINVKRGVDFWKKFESTEFKGDVKKFRGKLAIIFVVGSSDGSKLNSGEKIITKLLKKFSGKLNVIHFINNGNSGVGRAGVTQISAINVGDQGFSGGKLTNILGIPDNLLRVYFVNQSGKVVEKVEPGEYFALNSIENYASALLSSKNLPKTIDRVEMGDRINPATLKKLGIYDDKIHVIVSKDKSCSACTLISNMEDIFKTSISNKSILIFNKKAPELADFFGNNQLEPNVVVVKNKVLFGRIPYFSLDINGKTYLDPFYNAVKQIIIESN